MYNHKLEIGGFVQSGNRFRFRLRCVCVCVRACEAVCGREAEVFPLGLGPPSRSLWGSVRAGPGGPALPAGSGPPGRYRGFKKKFRFVGI